MVACDQSGLGKLSWPGRAMTYIKISWVKILKNTDHPRNHITQWNVIVFQVIIFCTKQKNARNSYIFIVTVRPASRIEKNSSSNFTELFHESRIQAIREQSVAQFSKLLAGHGERLRNNSKKFCNFKSGSRPKRVQ